ncbi:GTPase-associated system all-helical protein GASH [Pseudomonas sp. zfem005]|uniref:GTPase-associated system all-helical protein GASH n=1 Tax=Pseudomonas sp. zfem005 TaxID=3078200 RepID=UPI00292A2BAB|nr:GTPase-associated system all-helical protein GASH [Pseudomonas sp. zfem005]MDU9416282.1 GTPase-associated system all-helical protein GASH [Pseudomonas sp. zfem005]
MENFAVHMRICSVSVTDDDVNSRRLATTNLAGSWGKEKFVEKIISKASDIAEALGGDGVPSEALGNEVQAAIQKKSSSYLYTERPLDVSVCAGMAMISMFGPSVGSGGWGVADVYAAALWSSLAFQPTLDAARRESLRLEVLNAAAAWSSTSAEVARERETVPEPSIAKINISAEGVVTHNIPDSMAKTVEALRRNAALDREELDFLWWAQAGRSRILKRQPSEINEPTRVVTAGIEGSKMLRRLPCEVHREIILRTLENDPELDLAELLTALGDDRERLSDVVGESWVADRPSVFPLLYALVTGSVDVRGSTVKRRASEWGERALLEAGFLKLILNGPAKL